MDKQADPREAIELVARTALERYPSEEFLYKGKSEGVQLRAEREDGDIQQFLEQTHELLQMGAEATAWSDDQLESFSLVTEWIYLSFRIATELQGAETAAAAKKGPKVFDCAIERETCLERLGCTKSTWPCQCCAPCNLAFLACIYDAVTAK